MCYISKKVLRKKIKLKDTLLDKITNESSSTTVSEVENCFNLSLKLCEEIIGLDI